MSWIWKFLVTACLALIVHRVTRFVFVLGFYKPLYNHTPGPCHLVPGIKNGSEDMVTLTTGVTLITSGMQNYMCTDEDGIKGRVMAFDFNKAADGAKEVNIEGDLDLGALNPIGISAYEQKQAGTVTVFVINRPRGGPRSVEVFDYKQEKNLLTLKKSIKDDNIYTPNNIAATGPDSFYLNNDGYSDKLPIRLVEFVLELQTGSVVYYDGKEVRPVVSSFLYPNGVALSHTQKQLYIASSFGQSIEVYDIEKDASLTFVKSIHLATMVDNLTVDPDTGDIYAACQFNVFVGATQEGRATGSGQVLRIQLDKDMTANVREVLMDDGGLLRGSSVASLYKRHMLVGTLMGDTLFCRVDAF